MALDPAELKKELIDRFQDSGEVDYPADGSDDYDTAEPALEILCETIHDWVVGAGSFQGADLNGVADAGIDVSVDTQSGDGSTQEAGPLSGGGQ